MAGLDVIESADAGSQTQLARRLYPPDIPSRCVGQHAFFFFLSRAVACDAIEEKGG